MMCTPEVGLKSIFVGCFFMIEYDKFYFKFKVFQEYLNGLKIKVRIKTSKACLLKNCRRQAFKILH